MILLWQQIQFVDPYESLVGIDPHHPPTGFEMENIRCEYANVSSINYNFSKANYVKLNQEFSGCDWSATFTGNINLTVDDMVEKFYKVLDTSIKDNVPIFRSRPVTYPRWYNSELIELVKSNKKVARLKYKKYDLLEVLYREHVSDIESSIRQNINKFWSYGSVKNKTTGFPSNLHYRQKTANNVTESMDLLADHFSTMYFENTNILDYDSRCDLGHSSDPVSNSREDIPRSIYNLKSNFSVGPGQFLSKIVHIL